jgi:enamine deaminase RidA (YjgF/YER057c/UK114 family)
VTVERINPTDLPTPPTYSHVVVATGNRMVFIAGQEPEDADGNLVCAGDVAGPVNRCGCAPLPGTRRIVGAVAGRG